jgi:hypothetical protein
MIHCLYLMTHIAMEGKKEERERERHFHRYLLLHNYHCES